MEFPWDGAYFDRCFQAALPAIPGAFCRLRSRDSPPEPPSPGEDTLGHFPYQVHYRPQVDSTNTQMEQWLRQGYPHGTVLIAGSQGAGRGQWDRVWQSEPGGLYLSLGLRPPLPPGEAQRLNFGTLWGVVRGLQQVGIPVDIKWPNDLVLGGRKLGGVLVETHIRGDRLDRAIVGIGLNWRNPVPPEGVNLAAYGAIDRLETLAAWVLAGLALGYDSWLDCDRPLADLIPTYLPYLANLGQWIPLPAPAPPNPPSLSQQPLGQVVGLTPQGALILQTSDGQRHSFSPGTLRLGYGHTPKS